MTTKLKFTLEHDNSKPTAAHPETAHGNAVVVNDKRRRLLIMAMLVLAALAASALTGVDPTSVLTAGLEALRRT